MVDPRDIPCIKPNQVATRMCVSDKSGRECDDDGVLFKRMKASDVPEGCKFSLVGWVRHSLGRVACPYWGRGLPKEGVMLLAYIFEELTGEQAPRLRKRFVELPIVEAISHVDDKLTPQEASDVMSRALQRYDNQVLP